MFSVVCLFVCKFGLFSFLTVPVSKKNVRKKEREKDRPTKKGKNKKERKKERKKEIKIV